MIIVAGDTSAPVVPPAEVETPVTRAVLGGSGIVLNGDTALFDDFGCDWGWTVQTPWGGVSPRAVVGDVESDHGEWDATRFKQARSFPLEGDLNSPSHTVLHQAEDRFRLAVDSGWFVLRCIEPTHDRQALVRVDGELLWQEQTSTSAMWSVSLKAADPRLYATTVSTFSSPIPGGGQPTVPHEVPHPVSSSTLTRTAINEGTTTAWPKFTLQGPLPEQVSFGNPATGEQMTLRDRSRPGQPLLQAGEWLTLDTHPRVRRVLLFDDPQASRRGWLSGPNVSSDSPWWGFAPGSTTVTVSASSASGVSGDQITCEYRSTWL